MSIPLPILGVLLLSAVLIIGGLLLLYILSFKSRAQGEPVGDTKGKKKLGLDSNKKCPSKPTAFNLSEEPEFERNLDMIENQTSPFSTKLNSEEENEVKLHGRNNWLQRFRESQGSYNDGQTDIARTQKSVQMSPDKSAVSAFSQGTAPMEQFTSPGRQLAFSKEMSRSLSERGESINFQGRRPWLHLASVDPRGSIMAPQGETIENCKGRPSIRTFIKHKLMALSFGKSKDHSSGSTSNSASDDSSVSSADEDATDIEVTNDIGVQLSAPSEEFVNTVSTGEKSPRKSAKIFHTVKRKNEAEMNGQAKRIDKPNDPAVITGAMNNEIPMKKGRANDIKQDAVVIADEISDQNDQETDQLQVTLGDESS